VIYIGLSMLCLLLLYYALLYSTQVMSSYILRTFPHFLAPKHHTL
jgi:hypothetical protein